MPSTVLKSILTVKSSNGRVFEVNKITKVVRIFANETQYDADTSIGEMPMGELVEIVQFIKNQR